MDGDLDPGLRGTDRDVEIISRPEASPAPAICDSAMAIQLAKSFEE